MSKTADQQEPQDPQDPSDSSLVADEELAAASGGKGTGVDPVVGNLGADQMVIGRN